MSVQQPVIVIGVSIFNRMCVYDIQYIDARFYEQEYTTPNGVTFRAASLMDINHITNTVLIDDRIIADKSSQYRVPCAMKFWSNTERDEWMQRFAIACKQLAASPLFDEYENTESPGVEPHRPEFNTLTH